MVDPTSRFSRRALLKSGAIGALCVAVGGVVLAKRSTALRGQAPQRLTVLSAQEYAVLAAIAARICPKAGADAPGADALDVALRADAVFATTPLDVQGGAKLSLQLFENALTGALFGERIAPFTRLSPEQQDRVLENWRSSRITFRRTVYTALSSLILFLYWGDERTWPRIGYVGPDAQALRATYADNLVDLSSLRASTGGR